MKISVVIPIYKNHKIFLENLAHNLKILPNVEFVLVDDDPESDLKKKLRGFAGVYLKNYRNYGFSKTVNRGVKNAKGDLVVLLNTDVKVLDLDIEKIKEYFKKDSSLFAISFLQFDEGDKVGRNYLYWERGLFRHKKIEKFDKGINAWAEGGACVVDRKKFLSLGGFLEELYSPFYWEDIDLSYRAWKAGYRIIFAPEFRVEHKHESTISKYYKREKIRKIAYRNGFIFHWVNLTSRKKFFEHFIFLPFNLLKVGIRDRIFLISFFWALKFLPKVILQRKKFVKKIKRTDEEVLMMFKKEILREK